MDGGAVDVMMQRAVYCTTTSLNDSPMFARIDCLKSKMNILTDFVFRTGAVQIGISKATRLFFGMPYNWSFYHPQSHKENRVVYCCFVTL